MTSEEITNEGSSRLDESNTLSGFPGDLRPFSTLRLSTTLRTKALTVGSYFAMVQIVILNRLTLGSEGVQARFLFWSCSKNHWQGPSSTLS